MIPLLRLNDGHSIPQIGLGTYGLWNEEGASAIETAIGLGYRHLDTAVRYDNEQTVGEGVRRSGIDRAELFITTKLDGEFQGEDRAVAGLRGSLERLGTNYIDLLLIHWPLPQRGQFVSTWKTFEWLKAEGLTRSIGVSNFKPAHLETLQEYSATVPAVNQIELSPIVTHAEQRAYNAANEIITEAWTPIKGVVGDPVITRIAHRLETTPAQVVLRWHVQHGIVAIPKSSQPERMATNLDVFDFELSSGDMEEIAALDGGPDAGVDSDASGH
jgi:2,5-diketo-D-gluconate reductase A